MILRIGIAAIAQSNHRRCVVLFSIHERSHFAELANLGEAVRLHGVGFAGELAFLRTRPQSEIAMATTKKTKSDTTTSGMGMVGGAAAGAAAGAFLGPLGAAVGAVIGGVAGANSREIAGELNKVDPGIKTAVRSKTKKAATTVKAAAKKAVSKVKATTAKVKASGAKAIGAKAKKKAK